MVLVCPIPEDIDLDHLMKVSLVSGRFLHCKVIIFLFIISKYLVWRYFETMLIVGFSSYLYLTNFSTHH